MAEVRGCIRGEGEAPMDVLLAACALREGEAHVPEKAFYRDRSLTSVTIPEGVTQIDMSAFAGCSSLTSVTIPEGVTATFPPGVTVMRPGS